MTEPSLWYYGREGYDFVTIDVLETLLDRDGIRVSGYSPANILRDRPPLLSQNQVVRKAAKKWPRKENP